MNRLLKLSFNKYLLIALLFFSCINQESNKNINKDRIEANNFATWENPCFDRCASIWLINNFVDSTANFNFIKFGSKVSEGIPFDVPGAELGRQKNISCFESIILKYEISDQVLIEMSKIVHDIDVNKWGIKVIKSSDSLNLIFQKMRQTTENDYELLDKTDIFFNEIYNYLKSK